MEDVARTGLYSQLVEKAAACKLPVEATPLERFQAMWALYDFLNETGPIDLFLSVANTLNDVEPLLSEADKDVMRRAGCSFPEDWDNPRELFCGGE